MINKHKSDKKFIVITLLSTFLVIGVSFIYLAFFINKIDNGSEKFAANDTRIFIKDNILIKSTEGKELTVNLPKKLPSDHEYSFNFVAKKMSNNKKLFMYIKGSYLTFKLKYKDEIIFERKKIDNNFISSGGDFINIILIPDKYVNKELTISLRALKKSSYGILVPYIILGSHDDLILYSYLDDWDRLLIATLLLVFGIESFLVQIALLFYKKRNLNSFLSSLFAFILGLYILARTPSLFFLLPRGSFIYILDYTLFLTLPITVALFMINVARKKNCRKRTLKIYEVILSVFILNLIVQILLTISGYSEFIEFQNVAQFSVVSVALLSAIIPFSIKDFTFQRILTTSMAALMIVLIVLLKIYLTTYRLRYMTILGIVGAIFIIFQYIVVMKLYANTYTSRYKAELNKKLAFTDNLTRLKNRNAFENDIRNIDANGQRLMLMIIDLNNLKAINDNQGHSTGDYILKSIAEILNDTQNNYDKINAYRIGGDEFVITAFNVDYDYANSIDNYINYKSYEFRMKNEKIPFSFGIAYEITILDESFNINQFVEIVDKKMYEDKRQKKERIPIV